MTIDNQTGLVLEGGGMRGVFTSGVLDAFMKNDLTFPYVVAVSAGACNGMSYVSRQPRRARLSNIEMLEKYDYISLRHLVKQGCIFDPVLLYDKLPYELLPFDFDTFFQSPTTFEMVVTNCKTGLAEYLSERHDRQRSLDIVQASSSLPYVSKMVMVDGKPMLDGGIVDSIPVERAMSQGYTKNVVILTRNSGYRKTGHDYKIPHFIYSDYPRLRVALSRRLEAYNRQLELVEKLEKEGSVYCLRPERPLEVDRIEKDTQKLERLYEEGLQIGDRFCKQLRKWGTFQGNRVTR
ncbi:MAG: patatin family protein [Prevotella sp.]|nr:patatin family protein [Prevotella sp.]